MSTGTATMYVMLGYDSLRGCFNMGLLENCLGKSVGMACEWRKEFGKWKMGEREVVSSLIGNHISCLLYGISLGDFPH
jgi:hypothetical protein